MSDDGSDDGLSASKYNRTDIMRDVSRTVIDVSSINLQDREGKRVITGITLGDQ